MDISLVQIQITFGIVVSFAMGIPLPWHHYGDSRMNDWWQAMFILPGVIAALQIVLLRLYLRGDTPQWLAEQDKMELAEAHMAWIYKESTLEESIMMLKDSIVTTVSTNGEAIPDDEFSLNPGFDEVLATKYLKGLLICCGVSMFQQLSGVNTFIFYSSYIINRMGGHSNLANVYTTGLGAVNMCTTLLVLPFIDRKK